MRTPSKQNRPLAELLDDECPDELIAKALQNCLTASQTSKAGVIEPDSRIRLEAARLVMAYRHGTPIQRSENVTVNLDADNALGIKERLASSPALRDALRKMLAECDETKAIEAATVDR